MKQIKRILSLLLLITPFVGYSQKSISDHHKNATIESIKELIHTNYVFANRTKYFNNALDSLNLTGKYDDIIDYKKFSDALTEDLVAITNDKHFKVQYNPELVQSRRERLERELQEDNEVNDENDTEEEEIDWNLWYAQKENFGFEKVEILDGNIGYIKLNF